MPQLDFFVIFINIFWSLLGFFIVYQFVEKFTKRLNERKALILALKLKEKNLKEKLPKMKYPLW